MCPGTQPGIAAPGKRRRQRQLFGLGVNDKEQGVIHLSILYLYDLPVMGHVETGTNFSLTSGQRQVNAPGDHKSIRGLTRRTSIHTHIYTNEQFGVTS